MSQTLQFIYLVITECFYGDAENATCMRRPGKHDRVVRSEPFPLGMVPNSMEFLENESSPLPDDYYDQAEEIVDTANAAAADNSAEVAELKARIAELEEENFDLLETLAETQEEVEAVHAQMRGKGVAASTTPNEPRDPDAVESADHQRRGKAVGATGQPNASAEAALPFDEIPEDERTPQQKRARTVEMNRRASAE